MSTLKVIGVIWIILSIVCISIDIAKRIRVSKLRKTDPKAAVEAAEKGFSSTLFDGDTYVKQLTKIAEETGYVGAMLSLAEYYTGKAEKSKKG